MPSSPGSATGGAARPPHWRIPALLLTGAAVAQGAGAVMLVAAAPELARGWFYGPDQLALVHLYGLAMLTVAILAALAQLVPVLTRRPVPSDAVTAAAGGAVLIGGWLLAGGLWRDVEQVVALGGALVSAGCIAAVVQMAVPLAGAARARALGDAGLGIALALGWLLVVVALGMMLVIERRQPFLEIDRLAALGAHGVVAIGGWVGGAVMGVALRLAPMFSLAHGQRAWPGRAALGLWHPGVALAAVGLLTGRGPVVAAGAALGVAGASAFAGFLAGVLRHRHRAVEAPMRHTLLAAASAGLAMAAVLAAALGLVGDSRAGIIAVLAGLVGVGAGATSGHLFKILPMVVWTARHAGRAGLPGTPRLADMQPRWLSPVEQILFGAGIAGVLTGVALGSQRLVTAAAWSLVGAAAVVLMLAGAVLVGRAGARAPATGAGGSEERATAGPRPRTPARP